MFESNIQITERARKRLSPRQCRVLLLIATGAKNSKIHQALDIALGTLLTYNDRLYEKAELKNKGLDVRPAIVTWAFAHGYLEITKMIEE